MFNATHIRVSIDDLLKGLLSHMRLLGKPAADIVAMPVRPEVGSLLSNGGKGGLWLWADADVAANAGRARVTPNAAAPLLKHLQSLLAIRSACVTVFCT